MQIYDRLLSFSSRLMDRLQCLKEWEGLEMEMEISRSIYQKVFLSWGRLSITNPVVVVPSYISPGSVQWTVNHATLSLEWRHNSLSSSYCCPAGDEIGKHWLVIRILTHLPHLVLMHGILGLLVGVNWIEMQHELHSIHFDCFHFFRSIDEIHPNFTRSTRNDFPVIH